MTEKKRPQNYPLVMPDDMRADADKVAAAERRSLHAQILVWISAGIERWKKERENG